MAQLPLNKFLTKTFILTTASTYYNYSGTNTSTVYTAPIGVTSIVLMSQLANLTSSSTQYVNFVHHRNRPVLADAQGNGAQAANIDSFLVRDFAIPNGDAANVITGKLVIESLDSLRAFASNSGTVQLVLSILETANS
jgi:hypothetical protein